MQQSTVHESGPRAKGFRRLRSSKRQTTPTNGAQQSQSLQDTPKWSIYRSCSTLTLSLFRRCHVNRDFTALVKEGNPPEEVLAEAWLDIYSEYCGKRGGARFKSLIEKSKLIAVKTSRLDRLTILLEVAKQVVSDQIIEAFSLEGFKLEAARMQTADDDGYLKAVRAIESKLKTERMRLDHLISERDAPLQDSRTPEQRMEDDDESFTNDIVAVEEYMKLQINEDQTTVDKFCGYIRRLQKQIDHMNKMNSKNGQGTRK